MMSKITREEWLNVMATELKKTVFKQSGFILDLKKVKISCGYPSTGAKGKRIGECHGSSNNGSNEIFIHPRLEKSNDVSGVLAHELIHAYDDCKNGHGPAFRKIAIAIGLEGKMTATTVSDALMETINKIVKKIGKYPHKKLSNANKKKQTTRMIKVVCSNCNIYHVRMSRTMYEMAKPNCGYCIDNTDVSPFELKMYPEGEQINEIIKQIKKAV